MTLIGALGEIELGISTSTAMGATRQERVQQRVGQLRLRGECHRSASRIVPVSAYQVSLQAYEVHTAQLHVGDRPTHANASVVACSAAALQEVAATPESPWHYAPTWTALFSASRDVQESRRNVNQLTLKCFLFCVSTVLLVSGDCYLQPEASTAISAVSTTLCVVQVLPSWTCAPGASFSALLELTGRPLMHDRHHCEQVLEPGSTIDASDMLHSFLRRPPNQFAFLRSLGLNLSSTPMAAVPSAIKGASVIAATV